MPGEVTPRDLENLRYNCGPLIMSALEDPEVIEIMCNPDGRLWVERYGHDQECIGDLSKAQIKLILSLTASALEMTVDKYNPIIEGEFPLDGSRFEGVYPPLVGPYPAFDIRKLASKIITLPEYVANGEMSQNASDIIEAAVLDRKNIVVVGGTSSGKTTFVNAVIDAIARLTPTHRLNILEDTTELQSKSENVVRLHTSDILGAEVNMSLLAKVCMRLAPKRIIVGEVRDAAALAMLKLWNTGHPGGVATFHADSAEEALERLEELVEEAGFGPKQRLIGRAIDLVVYMEKTRQNTRQLAQILQVNGFDKKTETYNTELLYAA